jgi:hypothetical protein
MGLILYVNQTDKASSRATSGLEIYNLDRFKVLHEKVLLFV